MPVGEFRGNARIGIRPVRIQQGHVMISEIPLQLLGAEDELLVCLAGGAPAGGEIVLGREPIIGMTEIVELCTRRRSD
jgi:hypothetical protein